MIDIIPEDLPIPTVVAYGFTGSGKIPSVVVKDIKGAHDLVSYIVSRGHRKIGVIAGKKESIHTQSRLRATRRLCSKEGFSMIRIWLLMGTGIGRVAMRTRIFFWKRVQQLFLYE